MKKHVGNLKYVDEVLWYIQENYNILLVDFGIE